MCFGDDEDEETDVEEAARIAAEQAAIDAQNAAAQAQKDAAARRAQAAADSQAAAERRARQAADESLVTDDEEDLLDNQKSKRKPKGISSLRIDRTSSVGGTPMAGAGLTVG